jgi:1-acyl-sn-glycerol-3-phosphate acyltransferase
MLYPIVRPIVRVALQVFFKKIYISNADKLPKDKPVVLASNHPTAFLEPCILACFLDRPLYYLVRGDLFLKPLSNFLLRDLHMLPMFRTKDRGYAFIKHNFETFDACYDALRENKTMMIMAEGHTKMVKRLNPLKKGTARLAFGALEKYPDLEDVYVAPVGVNYTYGDRFRSEVMINFDDPILIRDYWEAYQANSNAATADFTEELRKRLETLIISIPDEADEELTESLLVMKRSTWRNGPFPVFSRDVSPLKEEMAVADRVAALTPEEKVQVTAAVQVYEGELKKHGIQDLTVARNKPNSLITTLLLALFAIPALAGFVFNYPPMRLGKEVARRRVRFIEFYSSVMLAGGLSAWLVYYIIWWIIALLIGYQPLYIALLLLPFLGWGALYYFEYFQRWINNLRWSRLPAEAQKNVLDLRSVASVPDSIS